MSEKFLVDFVQAKRKAASILGYGCLKSEREEVFDEFVKSNDVFVCLPTGYGKSLCYMILPVLFDILYGRDCSYSTIVMVTPLIAIMKDQVRFLERKGLKAVYVVKGCDSDVMDQIIQGKFQYIFTSPELLLTNYNWTDVFQSQSLCQRLVGLVVDEVHCVKKW